MPCGVEGFWRSAEQIGSFAWIGACRNRSWLQMHDAGLNEQKKSLWEVITSGEKSHGLWLTAILIAVEGEHLHWWLTRRAPV